MGTEAQADPNMEEDYDAAFNEATGEATGESEESKDFADSGDEPAAEAPASEGDGDDDPEGEPGDPEAAAEGEGGDEPAPEEPAAEGDAGAAASQKEPAADGEPEAGSEPAYDEDAVRQAAEVLRKHHEKQQKPAEPPAEDTGAEEGAAEPEEPPAPKTIDDYIPDDKRDVVSKYREEWSEVAEAEQVLRDAHLQQVEERIYSELRGALAPVFETTQKLQVNAHQSAIKEAHSDFDEVKQDLRQWIAEQPDFVRPAYEEVAKKGSAQQVIELVNYYKQATGKTGAVPEVPASSARTQQNQKPAQKRPPAAAKKAMAAAPSPSKAEAPGSSNPDDFDAAFDEAAGLG